MAERRYLEQELISDSDDDLPLELIEEQDEPESVDEQRINREEAREIFYSDRRNARKRAIAARQTGKQRLMAEEASDDFVVNPSELGAPSQILGPITAAQKRQARLFELEQKKLAKARATRLAAREKINAAIEKSRLVKSANDIVEEPGESHYMYEFRLANGNNVTESLIARNERFWRCRY